MPKNGSKTGPKQAEIGLNRAQIGPPGLSPPPLGAKTEIFGKKTDFNDGGGLRHPVKSPYTEFEQNRPEELTGEKLEF